MGAFLEIILGLLLEIFGNLLCQILIEIGFRSLVEPFRRNDHRNPLLAFVGCILLGTAAGFVSLFILPHPLYNAKHLQGYSLAFIPLSCGISMVLLRKLRERQGKQLVFIDSFTYGYTFAFFMTLVRSYRVL